MGTFIQTIWKECRANVSAALQAELSLKLKGARAGKMDGIVGFCFATNRSLIKKAASPDGSLQLLTLKIGNERKRGSERRTLRYAKRLLRRQCSKRLLAPRLLCKPYLIV